MKAASAAGGPLGPRGVPPFENLADPRSLFLGLQYSIAELPSPMKPRVADPRVGHFTAEVWDFTDDLHYTARKHYVDRWRLDKKDPAAALSEPVKPIVFWIDRNVPLKYRGVVREGILEWNKAFERIGFKDAIVVKQQPDDADFETADARHATVRWFAGTDVSFAIGPSDIDPRTGEILDADVAIPENWSRGDRRFLREDLGTAAWPAAQAAAMARGQARRPHVQLRGRGAGRIAIRPRAAAGARRDRRRWSRSRGVRDGRAQGRRDARGRARAGPAPQLPRVHGLSAGQARRSPLHEQVRPRRLGDGLRAREPRAEGRAAGRISPVDARSLRLLGDRVRLQADRSRPREAGTREDRRARRVRSHARLLVGRGSGLGCRSGREPVRLRQRFARVPRAPVQAHVRAVDAPRRQASVAGAVVRRAAAQLRLGAAPDPARRAGRVQVHLGRDLRA